MAHTFLFEEGRWAAKGSYYTETGRKYDLEGFVRIFHEDDLWYNEGFLKVVGEEGLEIRNRYEVIPLDEGQELTTWASIDPGVGMLLGTYTILEDCILCHYTAESKEFAGSEVLRQLSPECYTQKGVLIYKGKEKMSSWSIDLIKEM